MCQELSALVASSTHGRVMMQWLMMIWWQDNTAHTKWYRHSGDVTIDDDVLEWWCHDWWWHMTNVDDNTDHAK